MARYEVHLSHTKAGGLTLVSIEITDGKHGTVLKRIAADELALLVEPLEHRRASPSTQPLDLGAGVPAVIYIDLAMPAGRIPDALGHTLAFRASDGETGIVRVAPVTLGRNAPLVLGPPLSGGPGWPCIMRPGARPSAHVL